MNELFAKNFFNLESYLHAALFAKDAPVWEALHHLTTYLMEQKLGVIETEIPSSVHLINPSLISIGKGVRIEPGVYIEGPCLIGPNSIIRHGAYIRGNVITGERCIIGHDTEIKHSILLDRVCAAHFNYVGDCILGNDVNLGAGVKCANLRLDHAPVTIIYQNKKIPTHLKKFGAVIGDGSQLGCNGVTNPGTLMGKGAISYPCVSVSGYIPNGIIKKG